VFKGTKSRSEKEISLAIESKGGYLNASTSREWTSFYTHVLPEELDLAFDILSDLVESPEFPQDGLDRERSVILQEIKMFKDSPESLLFDHTFKSTFGEKHPLSRLILGNFSTVERINREDILEFRDENWTTDKIFISAAGKVDHESLCNLAERKITEKKGKSLKRKSFSIESKKINTIPKSELNHKYVALSFPSFHYNHDSRFAFLLSGTILGSGMSSRLFQRLRQDLSYVYEVSVFNEFFSDTGIFGIYFSTDEGKLQDSLNATRELLDKLDFTEEEVENAKERLRGNIMISLESSGNRMERNVKEEIYKGKRSSVKSLLKRINSVSLEEIKQINEKYLKPEKFVLTVLGAENNVSW
jgi:predicted Zn-dependent peptidase